MQKRSFCKVKRLKDTLKLTGLCCVMLGMLQGCLIPLAGLPFLGDSNQRFVMGHLGSRTKVKLKTIAFSAAHDANRNSATHVHLILLYDPHMIAEFINMSSAKYFQDNYYKQLQRDHRSTMHVYAYQFPPGARKGPIRVQTDGSPVAGFIIADYNTPGKHSIRIGEERHMIVMLDKDDWHVMPNEGEN